MLLDQLRELVKQPAAIARAELGPLSFERAPRGRDCFVDVGLVGFCNFGECLTRRRVRRFECFSRFRVDPLTVNEELIFFGATEADDIILLN